MSASKKIAVLCGSFGIAVAVAAGVAAPANAATPGKLTATLSIQDLTPGRYPGDCVVTVAGNIGMDRAQAQYLIDNGATAQLEAWGDDAFYDNRLFRMYDATLSASNYGNGLNITTREPMKCSNLDEDQSAPVDVGDEIYVKVIFTAPGYSRLTKNTNTVNGSYGFVR